jgi:hypothetical protein
LLPESISIQAPRNLLKVQKVKRGYTRVDAGIKVARSNNVPPFSTFGTTKKVPVIDKERFQTAARVFQEDRLTVVNVRGTNVN